MSTTLIIIIVVVLLAALALIGVVLFSGMSPFGTVNTKRQAAVSESLRSLVLAQRSQERGTQKRRGDLALAAAAESQLTRKKVVSSSRLTLVKKLKYAKWPITPGMFRGCQAFAAVIAFIPAVQFLAISWQILAPVAAWVGISTLLDKSMDRRFKAFDQDYPVLLLSYVSLLKTGMSTITGLEAAAKGLDEGSLVRAEVELMVERLRLGLTEEQAISAFGEDINHPELELFVQSLLLSRRVGGQLSSTLERLARQVRKRQQFRQQAVAAVGMEKSSIYAIAGIMSLLLGYLAWSSPDLIMPAFKHEFGLKMFQGSLGLIMIGFYWSKKVTNIKI